ncbi:hypothetical protein X975_16973, partial [Stegodyphus mimosarum]
MMQVNCICSYYLTLQYLLHLPLLYQVRHHFLSAHSVVEMKQLKYIFFFFLIVKNHHHLPLLFQVKLSNTKLLSVEKIYKNIYK